MKKNKLSKGNIDKYENIFAKLAEYHNVNIVPLVRDSDFIWPPRIKRNRILKNRNYYEEEMKIDFELLNEYILTNHFFFSHLNKELKIAIDLINTRDKENIYLGTIMVYTKIEELKIKIKNLI